MQIVAFVGFPGSGKSEAAGIALELLRDRVPGPEKQSLDSPVPVVRMGDAVREEVERLGLAPTDENVGGTGTRLRQEEGMDAIARRCIPRLESLDSSLVIVDGVRNIEEVRCFRERFGRDFILVAIKAPRELRFERIKMRGREDDALTFNEFESRDRRESGWGLLEAFESADFVIENTSTLEALREAVNQMLDALHPRTSDP